MIKLYSSRYRKNIIHIFAGEYIATKGDVVISTVVGSCIAVCLFDERAGVAGMNHFMLPFNNGSDAIHSDSAIYGISSMELLINEMTKLGASRHNLKAKYFGASNVLNFKNVNVASKNIDFIKYYLEKERIDVVSKDTGGNSGRKVLFFTKDFSVYVRSSRKDIARAEKVILEKTKIETSEVDIF